MACKKVYIQTFGCQMNVYDSQRMEGILDGCGYGKCDGADEADLIVLNTCSIRAKAAQKAFSELGRYRRLKEKNPGLIVAVGGCIAQGQAAEIIRRAPHVDLVFGTRNINRLPEFVRAIETTGRRIASVEPEAGYIDSLDDLPSPPATAVTAFVTIMQGCDNYCAFCVVPYLRGPEESRNPSSVVAEITALVAQGVKEVTLLGQNVNSYGKKKGGPGFRYLLERISEIDGLERIRFTTSHPRDLSEELIDLFGSLDKLCNHIHLPVQSGSNRILSLMNRGYRREDYLALVAALREKSPDISVTSDLIVGFPGETENDFSATIALMEEVRFDGTFSFKYSEREGTAAAGFDGKVEEEVRASRLRVLQALQDKHTLEKNLAWVGRRVQVLVEGTSENRAVDLSGRTRENRIVNFPGEHKRPGSLVEVAITEAYLHSLRGKQEEEGRKNDRNESGGTYS